MEPFQFRSERLESYVSRQRPILDWETLPEYARPLAHELSEQVRGMDFQDADESGGVSVQMFDRTIAEICSLVGWACSIWNQVMREVHRSRRLTPAELLGDTPLRDGDSPRDSLLGLFEGWFEVGDESDNGPYVLLSKYPFEDFSDDPHATVGNLSAAFGLAILDELLTAPKGRPSEALLTDLSQAWYFASIARWQNHMEMSIHFQSAGLKERMARAARARHSKDPKQQTKRQVYELWQRWESHPSTYPSAAAFSRAMLDKWPDQLSSEVVVARWVRHWKKNG